MRRPFIIGGLLALLSSVSLSAATIYSRASGNWTSTTVWSYTDGGASCGCTPTGSDVVYIRHVVNLNKHLTNGAGTLGAVTGSLNILPGGILSGSMLYDMDVRSGGSLDVCGWLFIRNLSFYNGSAVNICASANVVVNGSFNNRNNSNNVRIDGAMTVMGSYTNGNGGVISGAGTIVVFFGPVSNPGDTYGCVNTNPCSSFPCSISSPCGGTLAVKWDRFSAEVEGDSVCLKWTTASEEGSQRFVVQRSRDGTNFTDRTTVPAGGYSSTARTYSAVDTGLYEGWIYYRIKEESIAGDPSNSEVVAVRLEGAPGFLLVSDPATGTAPGFYTAAPAGAKMKLKLLDTYGNQLDSWELVAEQERKRYPIRTDQLNKMGVYLLLVSSPELCYYGRFFYSGN